MSCDCLRPSQQLILPPPWGVTLCFPCPVAGVELCPGEDLGRLHSQFPLEEATRAQRASSTEDSFGRADDSSSSPPLFVSGILSMIIIRTLRKDIANYNKEDDIVRGLGWGGMDLQREGSLAVGLWTYQTRTRTCACARTCLSVCVLSFIA